MFVILGKTYISVIARRARLFLLFKTEKFAQVV